MIPGVAKQTYFQLRTLCDILGKDISPFAHQRA